MLWTELTWRVASGVMAAAHAAAASCRPVSARFRLLGALLGLVIRSVTALPSILASDLCIGMNYNALFLHSEKHILPCQEDLLFSE